MSCQLEAKLSGRKTAVLLIGGLSAIVLICAIPYLRGAEPFGDDSSSHAAATSFLARQLADGFPCWWMPDLNLGFPLIHFYQPLPHFLTAIVSLTLGEPLRAVLAYKLCVVLLLASLPLTTYLGVRRLGISRSSALVSAFGMAFMSSSMGYGFTLENYLLTGLYTQLWGAVLAPIALTEGVRWVQGRGRLLLATTAITAAALSHLVLAFALAPILLAAAILGGASPSLDIASDGIRRRLLRLAMLFGISTLILAFWWVPMTMCSDYFGGFPFGSNNPARGFGLGALLSGWVRGRLTEQKGLVPIVGWLALIGLVWSFRRLRTDGMARLLVFAILMLLFFASGRTTFGRLVDIYPPNSRIELGRYVAPLQLALVLSAAFGARVVEGALRWLHLRFWPNRAATWTAWCIPALVLALGVPGYVQRLKAGLGTFPEKLHRDSFVAMADSLRADPGQGRVYTHKRVGHGDHWSMAYLSVLSGKPMGVSYGVGMHDSLSTYYLDAFQPFAPNAPALARLFNFRYVLADQRPLPDFLDGSVVFNRDTYRLVRLAGSYGYFDVIGQPRVLNAATPVQARSALRRWMLDELPRTGQFYRLPDPIHTTAPRLPARRDQVPPPQPPQAMAVASPEAHGSVIEEHSGSWWYAAEMESHSPDGWLLLKVTAHPYWSASLDGRPVAISYLSPSLMGFALPPGQHHVRFEFRTPRLQKILLIVAALALLLLVVSDRLRVRRLRSAV